MDPEPLPSPSEPSPSIFQWTLGFLLVGMAWGLTTPFIRRAAVNFKPPERSSIDAPGNGWLERKVLRAFYTVLDLLRSPGYAVPLLLNLTGSVWFFLLIGKAGESLSETGVQKEVLTSRRAEPDCTYYEFAGVLVYGAWGVVG